MRQSKNILTDKEMELVSLLMQEYDVHIKPDKIFETLAPYHLIADSPN